MSFLKDLEGAIAINLVLYSVPLLVVFLISRFAKPGSVMRKIFVAIMWALVVLIIINTIRLMVPEKREQWSIHDVEKMTDEETYLYQYYLKLCDRCGYGEEIDKLTEKERVIFVTQELAMEVNNGGFYQFYENSSGNFANEVISALETLGTERMLVICQKANAIFGDSVPEERDVRNAFLTHEVTFEQINILEECDKEFDKAYIELTELSYRYLKEYEKEKSEEDQ